MNVNADNVTRLLKYAASTVEDLSEKIARLEEYNRAMRLVGILEKRGFSFPGESLPEKTAALLKRDDYYKLAGTFDLNHIYDGIGNVSNVPDPQKLDALDRVILSN